MAICKSDLLKILLGVILLAGAALAQASEPCLSEKPNSGERKELLRQAADLLHGEEVIADSLYYCRYRSYSEANIDAKVVFDAQGLARKKWVYCHKNNRVRPALWDCKPQNVPVLRVPAVVDGQPRNYTVRIPPKLDAQFIRQFVPMLVERAQAATNTNSCNGHAEDYYLHQFQREFLDEPDAELFFRFELGVLQVWRGDSRMTFKVPAQEASPFEYLCWEAFDTL